jgi:hypothetical protein
LVLFGDWNFFNEVEINNNKKKYNSRESFFEIEIKINMQQLTDAEQVMEHLGNSRKAFMKDLLEAYPKPKAYTTTIATLLKE